MKSNWNKDSHWTVLGLFHLKVWGGGGGTEDFFREGEGPNFELFYPPSPPEF